jgi:serine protease Do
MRRPVMLIIAVCAVALPASGLCHEPVSRPADSGVPVNSLVQLSESLEQLAYKVSPAVVQIEVTRLGVENEQRVETGIIVRQRTIGAGVIVDSDGYIMTNAHLVEGAQRIRVMLSLPPSTSSDESFAGRFRVRDAKLFGSEPKADLALLKIDASQLPTLSFRLDRPPQPGELVFAVGSPGGLRNSVTMGVISSAWRQPDPDSPMVFLQTDAPINPGNSGGPLVDVAGAVVGLNTFILSTNGGSEGLGFAIPARIVDFVYQSLRKYGRVDHVDIGVFAQTISPALADGLGLAQNWGVVLADVVPHGPADAAGLQPGDVILAVDGHPMLSLLGFTAELYQHLPHQVLEIEALRGTDKMAFHVRAFPAHGAMNRGTDVPDPMRSHIVQLGILGIDLDGRLRSQLSGVRVGTGVVVLGHALGFDSVDAGLRPGDIIHALNRTPIESVEQLKAAVAGLTRGDSVVLHIERAGQFQYLAFEME